MDCRTSDPASAGSSSVAPARLDLDALSWARVVLLVAGIVIILQNSISDCGEINTGLTKPTIESGINFPSSSLR
jgi:hypothetical protein